jgi:hypothetical protein
MTQHGLDTRERISTFLKKGLVSTVFDEVEVHSVVDVPWRRGFVGALVETSAGERGRVEVKGRSRPGCQARPQGKP